MGKVMEIPLGERARFTIAGDRNVLHSATRQGILVLTPLRPGQAVITISEATLGSQSYIIRVLDPAITPSAPSLATSDIVRNSPGPGVNGQATPLSTSAGQVGALQVGTPAGVLLDGDDSIPARGAYRITGNAARLSVFAIAVDAQELFMAMGRQANLSIAVDDKVSRRVTVNMEDKPLRQITQEIVNAYGLSAIEVDGVMHIAEGIPRTRSSYLLSEIDSIPTKYVDAANARELLPVFLQDYVKVNAEQNAVVLSAPRDVLRKFREDIARFDIPASQIMVELLVVELTDTTLDQMGLSLIWQNAGRGVAVAPGAGSIVYSTISNLPPRFTAELRALQEKGKARVRANPRIATISGRQASIFVGRQRYVATPIEGTGQGQVNFIDAGVRLNITPYTGGESQVLVDVDTEVSTLSALDPVTRLPEKSTRTASTIVRVNNGQTIVIGGLGQHESREVRTRVPILGSIPVIGPLLFRTKDVRTSQTDLVLFITPRILSATGHLPDAEERALQQRFLDPDPKTLSRPLPPLPRMEGRMEGRMENHAPTPISPSPVSPYLERLGPR
jgi:protein transport protein HofQ/type IV pilus assembly protein PilQ